MERVTPNLYSSKSDCCGCGACYSICFHKAISMVVDEEGFEYPIIDDRKCVKCNACVRVCPIKNLKCIQ